MANISDEREFIKAVKPETSGDVASRVRPSGKEDMFFLCEVQMLHQAIDQLLAQRREVLLELGDGAISKRKLLMPDRFEFVVILLRKSSPGGTFIIMNMVIQIVHGTRLEWSNQPDDFWLLGLSFAHWQFLLKRLHGAAPCATLS